MVVQPPEELQSLLLQQRKSLDGIGVMDDHMIYRIYRIAQARRRSWGAVRKLYKWLCKCVANYLEEPLHDIKISVVDHCKSGDFPYGKRSRQDLENIQSCSSVYGIMEIVKILEQWLDISYLDEFYHDMANPLNQTVLSNIDGYKQLLQYMCCRVLVREVGNEPLLQELLQDAKTRLQSSGVLAVVHDLDYKSFSVAELLKEQKCLEESLGLPAGHLDCIRVEDGCVAIYWFIDKHYIARIMLDVRCIFWRLLELRVISLELLGTLKLSLKGRHVPYLIRDALLTGQDLIQQTEVKNVL